MRGGCSSGRAGRNPSHKGAPESQVLSSSPAHGYRLTPALVSPAVALSAVSLAVSLAVFLMVSLAVSGSVSDCASECPWQCFKWCGYFLTEHLVVSLALSLTAFLGVCLFVSISFSGISLLVCQAVSLAWFLTASLALWLCR